MQKYCRVQLLGPLIKMMMDEDPKKRPDAQGIVREWKQIRERVSVLHRACRLRGREEFMIETLLRDALSVLHVSYIIARRFVSWPLKRLGLKFP